MPRKPAQKAAPKATEKIANVLLRITPADHQRLRVAAAMAGKPMAVFAWEMIDEGIHRRKSHP